ncbi:hypothetical protein [Lysinibacillus sphaericus]|uniref:hypothetical protein n=1 Tax=Lysinibacillus sphaericus TaxID=1421 RepID=UPI003D7F69ED
MIRAKHTIRHNNKEYKKGVILDGLTSVEEERLVFLKSAEYVLSPEEELKKQQVAGMVSEISREEFEELSASLDDLYNAEELKRAAKEVGVDLTGTTRKEHIIDAIIKQGKADELLEDANDE